MLHEPVQLLTKISRRYVQMSGMVLGSMIDADAHLRQYEHRMRIQRRYMRDQARWERYEQEINSKGGEK